MTRSSAIIAAIAALLSCLTPSVATATSVPVFRYALERWTAEAFPLFLIARDTEADATAAEFSKTIDTTLWETDGYAANAELYVLKSDAAEDPKVPETLKKIRTTILAKETDESLILAVGTPHSWGPLEILWSAAATKENLMAVRQSPTRRAIERGILDGDSAIMLLVLPEGRDAKDPLVASTVKALEKITPTIELPEPTPGRNHQRGRHGRPEVVTELRVSFPLMTMTTAEKDPLLRTILARLDQEAGNPPASTAKLYAIFGQGRAVGPLIEGDDLDEETLEALCGFVTGACSCQVKSKNPGLDLLCSVDWWSFLGGSLIPTHDLPPLVGAADLQEKPSPEPVEPTATAALAASSVDIVEPPLVGSTALLMILGGTILAILIGGTIILTRH